MAVGFCAAFLKGFSVSDPSPFLLLYPALLSQPHLILLVPFFLLPPAITCILSLPSICILLTNFLLSFDTPVLIYRYMELQKEHRHIREAS